MATRNQKIHGIIHTASAACAAVGAGLAQAPGSDASVIIPLQTAMITAIALEYGWKISETVAADLLLTFVATTGGRFLSQLLVGWIPGFGNVINASTAATLTEAIGWAADELFGKKHEESQKEQT